MEVTLSKSRIFKEMEVIKYKQTSCCTYEGTFKETNTHGTLETITSPKKNKKEFKTKVGSNLLKLAKIIEKLVIQIKL
jgi:hypothetical protein